MELSKVKEIITPAGSLKKILRNDVVIWSKKSDLVYTIWKNGVLIDRVTMPQFVNKIHNGNAQTDYGIGAQIYVPYTDPFNGVTYDCPFNFGTFTQYPGKLGLQTHYALPSKAVSYGNDTDSGSKKFYCVWNATYAKKWLNTSGTCSFSGAFEDKNGFLSCIPQDFVDTIQDISFSVGSTVSTDCKIFLLSATQSCVNPDYDSEHTSTNPNSEGTVWEYWQNRIGTPQEYKEINSNRITYLINDKNSAAQITIPSIIKIKSSTGVYSYYMYGFSETGKFQVYKASTITHYQPACVIG